MSAREKLQLVDELWMSVAPELDALEVPNEEKAMLDERRAAFLEDPPRRSLLSSSKRG